MDIRIVDVTDLDGFRRIPPCADPGFDHRSCDYWEDARGGSKAARLSWFGPGTGGSTGGPGVTARRDPFGGDEVPEPPANPFKPGGSGGPTFNPFVLGDEDPLASNPFAPRPPTRPTVAADAPRKLALLARGLGVFGSYAKVLLVDDEPAVYAQFGPLSAYPRALRLRQLYAQLPDAPLPAVITCIATTRAARGAGHARALVAAVCDDLAGRGFAAVEAYPEVGAAAETTSGASPSFWLDIGFSLAVDDERFPVVRRELG